MTATNMCSNFGSKWSGPVSVGSLKLLMKDIMSF